MKLLNAGNNKTVKGEKWGWRTYGLHLAPYNLSGKNVCSHASTGCAEACLNTAGRGIMHTVQEARIKKTKWFFEDRESFISQLSKEVVSGAKSAVKKNLHSCFRLNLTSDLPWHQLSVIKDNPLLRFYDYTKDKTRFLRYLSGLLPSNYHLTFSRSENTRDEEIHDFCRRGGNVAVVFKDHLPSTWQGIRVVNGDINDLRFQDPSGIIVGLKAKGTAGKKDKTGFVLEPSPFPERLPC